MTESVTQPVAIVTKNTYRKHDKFLEEERAIIPLMSLADWKIGSHQLSSLYLNPSRDFEGGRKIQFLLLQASRARGARTAISSNRFFLKETNDYKILLTLWEVLL